MALSLNVTYTQKLEELVNVKLCNLETSLTCRLIRHLKKIFHICPPFTPVNSVTLGLNWGNLQLVSSLSLFSLLRIHSAQRVIFLKGAACS